MLWRRGKAYGQDLRERVFAAADGGTPVGEIAEMLLVSISYASKALSRRARTGETTARPDQKIILVDTLVRYPRLAHRARILRTTRRTHYPRYS
jgi:hypothetical protein